MCSLNLSVFIDIQIRSKTDLKKKKKMILKKTFFKLMNNAVFGKLWKIYKKKKVLNLSKQKEEEII